MYLISFPGELHVPLEVCGAVVKRELDYWQINENHIKSCCWRNYRSYIENKRILDSFNRSILKQQMCINVDEGLKGWQRFRTKVWMLLEYPRTSTAAMVSDIDRFLPPPVFTYKRVESSNGISTVKMFTGLYQQILNTIEYLCKKSI